MVESSNDQIIIGIDLGMTKSVVSFYDAEQGKVVVLCDEEGNAS